MSDNKFMAKLHGEKAVKSVLEIKKYGDDRPFANMPNGSSEANIGTDTQINHGISYVRGTQVWKIDGSSMSVADNDYTGSGADKTGEVEVSGQGLWVDATYVFPNNLTEDTLAAVISAHPKFVVNLFGDNLFNGSNTQIDLTVLLKLGNTNLVAKTFSVMPQANFFHKQLEIGFDESIDDDTYFEQGARLTLQVICSDPTATARIYTGMSNLVLMNRKIDTNLVSPDFQDFDEWVYRVEEMETKIDKVIVKSETIPDASTVDAGSVYMYMGETNPTYTHGYIYQNIVSTEDVMTFSDDSISCDWTALSAFLARHGADYNSVVKGTMEYVPEANLWRIVFNGADDSVIFSYQQYTGDWEEAGFTFGKEFTSAVVVSFTRTTVATNHWERMDVQPGAQWGNITGDLADQEDLSDALDTINDRIDNVEARGRFLALWDAVAGLPESTPQITPYTYKTGDYYIVGTVGETNYRPSGTEFVEGQPSTEVETEELTTDDVYYYDGAVWRLQVNHGKTVSFANLAGEPEDNTALKQALDAKQPVGDYATNDAVVHLTGAETISGSKTFTGSAWNGVLQVKTMTTGGSFMNFENNNGQIASIGFAYNGIPLTLARNNTSQNMLVRGAASGTAVGSSTIPVYINNNGIATACAQMQPKLTAGANITIDSNNVISATGGGGGGAVESVNGKTGTVVLTGEDISADVSELTDTVQGHLQTLHDNIKDIELFKFPNATIIGEPIIDHGQISGFSESSYLQFPFIVDLHNQPFVIDFCFTTGNDVTTQQNILDSQFGLALAIANGFGLMAISHNGTSWAGAVTGTLAIQPNTTYYARLSWNRILYKTELSTDGTTYTSDMTFGSTQSPYPRTMFIGGCSGSAIGHTPHPFGGTINLNYAYLTVAGNVIWQGMDDAGLSTRADVSLDNLDEFGQAKVDSTKNKNEASAINRLYSWSGTLQEAQDQNVRELHPDWQICITDDVSGGDSVYTKNEVDTGFSKVDMSNVVATGKERVVGWCMPDYMAGVTISTTAGNSFTMPVDALVYVSAGGSSRIGVYKDNANGTRLAYLENTNSNTCTDHVLVQKGTVLYIPYRNGSYTTLMYFPLKGVQNA